jgi:crotonobetainyl-CoA:carnitine CoA-transferase CaiB-like acyl-CoA transferase
MGGRPGASDTGRPPLADVRIIDLTRVFSGPFATQILADLGADVVKVERLEGGDEARSYGVLDEAETIGPPFLAMNRNKRSIAIDIRSAGGHAVMQRLVANADVLIDNFRPGVMERLGLDYSQLTEKNRRLICCSISGFGSGGHLWHRAANDLQIQAFTGLLGMTGYPGDGPVRTPAPVGDLSAGLFAAVGILAALQQRQMTGYGQRVETSMVESLVNLLNYFYVDYWLRGRVQPKMGTGNALGLPNQAFPTSDGWVCISTANEAAFARCCQVIGRPEAAADDRFSSLRSRYANREALVEVISAATAKMTTGELLTALDDAGVSCSPVRTLDEMASDPLLGELGAVTAMAVPGIGDVRSVALPIHLGGAPLPRNQPPPRLGEHTIQILHEAGYGGEEIAQLIRQGIVLAGPG